MSAPVSGHPTSQEESAPPINPLVYRMVVQTLNIPLVLRGDYIHVLGREHIPPPGRRLVVAGAHFSAFDPFVIAKAMPEHRVQFMAKRELFMPVIGNIIRAGGSFPVDRSGNDVTALRNALRVLKAEGTLGLFPQGTRGGSEMHGGVALLAMRGRAPILPVGLNKSGHRWLVHFGPLIEARGSIKDVTAQVGAEIERLSQPL